MQEQAGEETAGTFCSRIKRPALLVALNRTRPPAALPVHFATQLDIETMICDTGDQVDGCSVRGSGRLDEGRTWISAAGFLGSQQQSPDQIQQHLSEQLKPTLLPQ